MKVLYFIVITMLVSCGNTSKPDEHKESKKHEFTISAIGNSMSDMAYDTKSLTVNEGSSVIINLINKGIDGAMIHNIVIVKEGTEKEIAMEGLNYKDNSYFNPQNTNVIAGSALANPGQTVKLEFIAPEKGLYTYLCTYPGHWMAMRGTLTVE